ncbi:MAG TPA: MMPL family transporter [Burkholderiaceae bacterium]|nr:MMPL family transporter [Burkholderiaceae bacterium]
MSLDAGADRFPVVADSGSFDRQSGNRLERLIFNHRLAVLVGVLVLSILLGWSASGLTVNANFERMIPQSHPWIKNYFANQRSLAGLGNRVQIVVENTAGDIFDPHYLEILRRVNDRIYPTKGVDRSWVKSIWMPIVRWTQVTEAGVAGGPVMPDNYDGSAAKMAELRNNVQHADIIGSLVGNDLRSSAVVVPLLDRIPVTGEPIDYVALNRILEEIRALQGDGVRIRIVGFAKLVGDLIAGLAQVLRYFALSALIATAIIFIYTRCVRSTLLLVGSAALGVVWLLGLMHLMHFELDPYSILVPFLIFAIGLSHGAQKMNGIMQDIARGTHKYVAARYTFRRLFLAGLTALLTNIVGFAVLMVIDIPVIRDLALTTSIGVGVLIFTKLILMPVMLSFTGVSAQAAQRQLRDDSKEASGGGAVGRAWRLLDRFTERRWASVALLVTGVAAGCALLVSLALKVGDLDAGAPELRPDSRYNTDLAYVNQHYATSSDLFVVMTRTPVGGCETFETLTEMNRLGERLRDTPGVLEVRSAADGVRQINAGNFEGNPKWLAITRVKVDLAKATDIMKSERPELASLECTISPVIAYLADHKADTLVAVAAAADGFAAEHDTADRQFLLAAGSAGIEASTNAVVGADRLRMLVLLYSAVVVLCLITFRSWRAVVVAVIPLLVTSTLCEALMVTLGIGVKVATLPVIALGVGVGVDYALYLLSVQLYAQRHGATLPQAYRISLNFTGKVVALIGLTMAAGVCSWAWSPIKFQTDMGILLTFMFLWNMVGALVLIPALSYFLLRTPQAAQGAGPPQPSRNPDEDVEDAVQPVRVPACVAAASAVP